MTVTVVDAAMDALDVSVPVKVKTYFPAVVAEVPTGPFGAGVLLPPQPSTVTTEKTERSTSIEIQRRRREGMPPMSNSASTAPPPPILHRLPPGDSRREAVEAAVVWTVSTLVPVPPEAMATLVGFMAHVGRLCAPVGEVVSAQVTFRVPW